MPPNVQYLLSADLVVEGGTALIAIGEPPAGPFSQATTIGLGAQRLRVLFEHTSALAPANVIVSILTNGGADIRIDSVSLKPAAVVALEERIQNGTFEGGFHAPADYWQSSGLLANSWARFGTSSSAVVFDAAGSLDVTQQFVEHANVGDGIGQDVTVVPGQRYLLRANITGWGGAARMGIGPVGAGATHTVGWCGGGGIPHTLSMLYTPPAGQTSVTVSVAGAWDEGATFYVDEVSLLPTTLTYVDPGAPQGECVPRHTLTFQVHDSATQSFVEGALVEISPTWGSGPARFTYQDGTISYEVGPGSLQYTISKSGYPTKSGVLNITGAMTFAVDLMPSGPPPPGGCTISVAPATADFLGVGGEGSVGIITAPGCSWTASSQAAFVTITAGTGVGNGELQYSVAPNGADFRSAGIVINGELVHTVYQLGSGDGPP